MIKTSEKCPRCEGEGKDQYSPVQESYLVTRPCEYCDGTGRKKIYVWKGNHIFRYENGKTTKKWRWDESYDEQFDLDCIVGEIKDGKLKRFSDKRFRISFINPVVCPICGTKQDETIDPYSVFRCSRCNAKLRMK